MVFYCQRMELTDLKNGESILDMKVGYPGTLDFIQLEVHLDGDQITQTKPEIGLLHRGLEKHFENLTYQEISRFLECCGCFSTMNVSLAYILTVENLLGITVPDRAQYIRVIVAELNRIASHLGLLGKIGSAIGAVTPFKRAFRDQEKVFDLFEILCGSRMLKGYFCIGGVKSDLSVGFIERTYEFIENLLPKIEYYFKVLSHNRFVIRYISGLGVIPPDVAINYGITGPNLRASGVKWDLRKDESYSIYDRFDFDVPIGQGLMGYVGDCWDRYWTRIKEMVESVKIIRQALDQLPDKNGQIKVIVADDAHLPAYELYFNTESPNGELGFYLISDGSEKPYRLKMRSPSFSSLSAIDYISRGSTVSALPIILASLDINPEEIDR